jgi:hypothetical protein
MYRYVVLSCHGTGFKLYLSRYQIRLFGTYQYVVCTDIIQISVVRTSMYRLVPPCTNTVTVQGCTRLYRTTSAKWGVHIYYQYAEYGQCTILHIDNRACILLCILVCILCIISKLRSYYWLLLAIIAAQ